MCQNTVAQNSEVPENLKLDTDLVVLIKEGRQDVSDEFLRIGQLS